MPEMQLEDGTWIETPARLFGDASVNMDDSQSAGTCSGIPSFEVNAFGYPASGRQVECSSIGGDFCNQKRSPGNVACTEQGTFAFRRFLADFDTCQGSSGGPVVRTSDDRVVAVNNAQGSTANGELINFAVRVRQFTRFQRSNDRDFDCQPPGGGVDISCLIGKLQVP